MNRQEAIQIIKNNWPNGRHMLSEALKFLIPELKESEDERIRKEIICVLKGEISYTSKEENEKYIAWLEKHGDKTHEEKVDEAMREIEEKASAFSEKHKGESSDDILAQMRGEQNLADKVEPKFKAGDWVVWDNKVVCNITGYIIKGGKKPLMYIITDTNGMERTYSVNGFDNNARLLDITKDAKDGDVLFTSSTASHETFILKSIDEKGNAKCYFAYDSEDGFREGKYHFIGSVTDCKPATKEQRDLLFKKMKEAGYEWDAEKKELKKVEQKPAWSGDDEKLLKLSLENLTELKDRFGEKYGKVGDCIQWLKSLKEKVKMD